MNTIKKIIAIAFFAVLVYSCEEDYSYTNPFSEIDHEALAISDNDTLVAFLKNHYFDKTLDSVKPLISGEVSLYEDGIITMEAKISKLTSKSPD